MTATMVSRRDRAAEAARLRDVEGLNGLQIAARMGVSKSYAYELLTDPDGVATKARKSKGACVRCGAAIRSDSPSRGNPERCVRCCRIRRAAGAKWTRLAIATAIQRWQRTFGVPPTAADWNVATLRVRGADSRIRRFYDHPAGPFPHPADVQRRWRSWNAAIAAAGFEPRACRSGGVGHGPGSLTDEELGRTVALVEEHGVPHAAKLLGLTPNGVRVRLRKTDRKELLTMGTRLAPVDVMRREIERLVREIAEAEQRITEKQAMVAQYEQAIKVLAGSNGAPKG